MPHVAGYSATETPFQAVGAGAAEAAAGPSQPEASSPAADSGKWLQHIHQNVVKPHSTAGQALQQQQLPQLRQDSGPRVLKGRVQYTFATRNADDTEPQAFKSKSPEPCISVRTAAAIGSSSRDSSGSSSSSASAEVGEILGDSCLARNRNRGDGDCSRSNGRSTGGGEPCTASASSKCGRIGDTGVLRGVTSFGAGGVSLSASPISVSSKAVSSTAQKSTSRNSSRSSSGSSSSSSCCCDRGSSSNPAQANSKLPPLPAADVAVLVRDFAAFMQRVERQMQQLQKQQQQKRTVEDERGRRGSEQQHYQQNGGCARGGFSAGGQARLRQQLLQQTQQQEQAGEDVRRLRRSIAEASVVCRSLHRRLCVVLLDTAADASAEGSGLLLAKLRRDFSKQQQQYTRLLRLLDSSAELLREPSNAEQQQQGALPASSSGASSSSPSGVGSNGSSGISSDVGPAKIVWHVERESYADLPLDATHFALTRARHAEGGQLPHNGEKDPWGSSGVPQQSWEVNLPPLLIGGSSVQGPSGTAGQSDVWEPAALVEVDEDYEQQQILSERKQQLQQLQHVEVCVSALRELQEHVAADVAKGAELLQAAEEDIEVAAELTAAGTTELAGAARSKSRWWGVQGGGAAALLGVSVGAIAGGPVGAAVGAVVGAVAGVSSGAALRGRHHERINTVERSVHRRRALRTKGCLATAAARVDTSDVPSCG